MRMPMSAATETVIKNQPMPWPSPKRAPSFRLVRYQSMFLMTGHPGLVPGMPRFLNARAFVIRSAPVVRETSDAKTVHVRTFARCEEDEGSVGIDSVRSGSVTARVDLQKWETGDVLYEFLTSEVEVENSGFAQVARHSECMLGHMVMLQGVSL